MGLLKIYAQEVGLKFRELFFGIGITALNDLIQSLATKRPLYLSGYCDEFGCFTGGRMDFTSLNFTPLLGNTCYSKKKIRSIAKKHCESYFSATSNQEHKE